MINKLRTEKQLDYTWLIYQSRNIMLFLSELCYVEWDRIVYITDDQTDSFKNYTLKNNNLSSGIEQNHPLKLKNQELGFKS